MKLTRDLLPVNSSETLELLPWHWSMHRPKNYFAYSSSNTCDFSHLSCQRHFTP